MKDFFDLYVLSQEFGFTQERLSAAVRDAFARRSTQIPTEAPDGLTQDFARDSGKLAQWKAFLTQNVSAPRDTLSLDDVIEALSAFLLPILIAARITSDQSGRAEQIARPEWVPGGPWGKKDG